MWWKNDELRNKSGGFSMALIEWVELSECVRRSDLTHAVCNADLFKCLLES